MLAQSVIICCQLVNNPEVSSMNNALSLAYHITLELRPEIIGGRLLPGMALVERDLVLAYNAS
ncbi:hypothetical protein BK657_00445 [Pseudomonas brassicacearum]|nr:hypothetical protein BK656_29760 [Pseudomonas brassicacearum]RON07641.1 hypothetical protein BK657_00445 [Pseudomonas brassicacearum]